MSECGNRHEQMRKPRRKFAPAPSKGNWIEHKGTWKVNQCS
jgi:hypothetical protein